MGYLVSRRKTAPEGKTVASMSVDEEQEEKKSYPYPGSCRRQPIAKNALQMLRGRKRSYHHRCPGRKGDCQSHHRGEVERGREEGRREGWREA